MPETTSTAGELNRYLRADFSRKAQKIQMLPAVAMQALDVAKKPDCSVSDFLAVIERDPKLATDILSMSNSPLFATGGSAILSLQKAVVRLGFRQCRNLILSTSLTSMMRNVSLKEEWISDVLSRHAFLTGITAMHVNRIIGTGFQGEEFAAGLIHDFGRTLLAVCMPNQFSQADPLDFDESSATPANESLILDTDHCQAGAWFAEISGLPSELVEVIRHHHCPSNAVRFRRLVALTALCDHIANYNQQTNSNEDYNLATNEAVYVLEETGIMNVAGRLTDLMPEIVTIAKQDAEHMIGF